MSTVIICCYGIFGPTRTKEEMNGLRQYFGHCAKYILRLNQEGELSGIILAGGFTNQIKRELSEAATSCEYLKSLLPDVEGIPFLVEEKSSNTPQNLYFSTELAYKNGIGDNLIVVCDRYRYLKVLAMLPKLRSLIPSLRSMRVVSFPRKDIHPHSSWPKQLGASLIYWLTPRFFNDLHR